MNRFINTAAFAVCIGVFGGCGKTNHLDKGAGKNRNNEVLDTKKARWDQRNEPSIMDTLVNGQGYRYEFSSLPLSGSLSQQPWSGDYWPTYKGGITYRWNDWDSWGVQRYGYRLDSYQSLEGKDLAYLSPSEKFDLFLGRYDYPLTHEERRRTRIMKTVPGSYEYIPGYKIPYWEGLCHSWAPATAGYQEPNPITLSNPDGLQIPFGSSDIKALLTYFLHETPAKTQFLGMRCNIDVHELYRKYRNGEISWSYYQQQKKACADTNAGSFHLVLSNQIGLLDEAFFVDVSRGAEVWNQAVYSYETVILQQRYGASRKAAPGTVKEIKVHTRMFYTTEIPQSFERPLGQPVAFKDYYYWLEINRNGEIIGGEWLDSRANRPDFLWKQEIPEFWGDYKFLEEIYNLSIQVPEEPEEPGEPTEPTEPEEPSEPIGPTEPEEPSEPTEPTESEEPSEPTEPTEPEEPVEPTEPVPIDPTPTESEDSREIASP